MPDRPNRIQPRTLKGFRDYLPAQMMNREHLMDTARRVYRSFGFRPIDTPALEYAEILTGKGSDETDKQMFRFRDQGDRDVALRFDLTIPFARFAAQHFNEIGVPFKRYHIGTVWRGEKPQAGRYREFMQCDFDTIGTESNLADIETLLVIHDLFAALGFERFTIRVNNRKVLNGLLQQLGLLDRSVGVLRAIDKLEKIGSDGVAKELRETVSADDRQIESLLKFAGLQGTTDELLEQLPPLVGTDDTGAAGICDLQDLFAAVRTAGVADARVKLDLSIARGLDYYTGTIYETVLDDLPGIGSVCSGGRYDNLAGLFTSQSLPGVGASLGLDRLLAAMEELSPDATAATPAQVLIAVFSAEWGGEYFQLARRLRAAGIATEVFPNAKAVKKQMKYANRQGFRYAILAGEDEFATGTWQIKDLQSGTQENVADADVVSRLQAER